MGEYLSLLTQVKNYIYNGRAEAARDTMKRLLNFLNIDYTQAKNPAEKEKIKKAFNKLMPAYEELKAGTVSASTIAALALDMNRVPAQYGGSAPAPQRPVYPQQPAYPQRPAYPQQPAYPQRPAYPQQPAYPQRPAYPQQPAYPQRPAYPQQPAYGQTAQPAQPAQPKQPAAGGWQRPPQNRIVKNNNAMMPLTLDDYIGQEKAKRSLRISINASKKTGRPLAHMLICSSYGLGKTTLTNIIANEMGMPFFNVNATTLKDVKSLSLYFSKIEQSCIVFIDEIHTLKKEVQTVLLSIMTDFTVNLIDESGEEQHFDLPPFTLIGATTQAGELLKPFLNRFAMLELEDYTDEEKLILVNSKFKKLGYEVTEEAAKEIAGRCRGVPRTIETYVKGAIDVALAHDVTLVDKSITDEYFEIHEIDSIGLTKNDLKVLTVLDESVKPIALITMESKVGIQREDLEFRYEPYLFKLGFIDKTMQGRIITEKGRNYLHPEQIALDKDGDTANVDADGAEDAEERGSEDNDSEDNGGNEEV